MTVSRWLFLCFLAFLFIALLTGSEKFTKWVICESQRVLVICGFYLFVFRLFLGFVFCLIGPMLLFKSLIVRTMVPKILIFQFVLFWQPT